MTRPSPTSRRRRRTKPSHRKIAPSAAVKEILNGDYPQRVKVKVFLAASSAAHGARACILCGADGVFSRVHVPPEALTVDRPDYRGIRSYWLCQAHSTLEPGDEQITAALQQGVRS
jgi:hypothetical protein